MVVIMVYKEAINLEKIYRENDNLNEEAINRYRQMSQEERDKLMKELEEQVLKEKKIVKEFL